MLQKTPRVQDALRVEGLLQPLHESQLGRRELQAEIRGLGEADTVLAAVYWLNIGSWRRKFRNT